MIRATRSEGVRQAASAGQADGHRDPACRSRANFAKIEGCAANFPAETIGMVAESKWHVD
jgi:hypothetical protein